MKRHATARWRRNQVEAALWRYTVTQRQWGQDWDQLVPSMPDVFRSRLKKLLNMDRIPSLTPWDRSDQDMWAFYDGPGEGVGSEDRFSDIHAFLMGIGLDLVNEGLKQSEVLFFLRHCRSKLEEWFQQIRERPGALAPVSSGNRQHETFEDDGSCTPIWLNGNQRAFADRTAWIVIRRFEAKEAFPRFEKLSQGRKIPFFVEPEFYFGLEELKKHIFKHLPTFRHLLLVEIADLAMSLPRYLAETPAVPRGRPRRSADRTKAEKPRPGRAKNGGA